MKSFQQFREQETVLDKKRQEMLKSRKDANKDFEDKGRQDELQRTMQKNKDDTDRRLDHADEERRRIKRAMGM